MDDRHPSKSMPQCKLGHLLKIVLDEEEFINKVSENYNCKTARVSPLCRDHSMPLASRSASVISKFSI